MTYGNLTEAEWKARVRAIKVEQARTGTSPERQSELEGELWKLIDLPPDVAANLRDRMNRLNEDQLLRLFEADPWGDPNDHGHL